MLIKATKSEPYQTELDALNKYKDDFDVSVLPAELLTLRAIFANEKVFHFEEIKSKIKTETSEAERILMGNVIKMMMLVGAAASTTPERFFSLARRLKTWLRYSMSQKCFNALAILSFYKELVDKISLTYVANEFVDSKPMRKDIFEKFVKDDL